MTHQRYNPRPRNPHGLVSPGQKYTTIHLRLLSPELRDMVFAISLLRTDSKTPALLVALRTDEELYRQALKVYYSMNEMGLAWTDGLERFDDLKKEILGVVKKVVVTVPNNPTTTSHIHATLTLLPNITSLKLRSPNTTLLRTFNISSLLSLPSAINSKPQFPHLTNLQLKVKLKTASYPSFLYGSGGVMAEAQKRGDEYHAIQEARKIRGAVEKLVRKEGEERWIDVAGPAILVVGWETERGKVLGEVEE